MITTETTKGLRERPMLYGIRGEFVMYLVASLVLISVVSVVAMVLLFFKKQYGLAILTVLFWIVGIIGVFFGFRIYSREKMYKKMKRREDIITNKDLKDYL